MAANVGEAEWSGDVAITVGSDQGEVIVYHCPGHLEPQPVEEGQNVELHTLKFRPGEMFVIQLF